MHATRRIMTTLVMSALLAPAAAPAISLGEDPTPPVTSDALPDQTMAPDADAVIERVLAGYRSLKTYQHKSEMKFVIEGEGLGMFGMALGQDQEGSLKYARPNLLALVTDRLEVFSDGSLMWTAMKTFGQYTEQPATDPLAVEMDAVSPFGMQGFDPIAILLTNPTKSITEALPLIEEFKEVSIEKRGERNGKRVSGSLLMPMCPQEQAAEFSMWISDKTRLIEEIKIDLKPAYEAMMANGPFADSDDGFPFEPPTIEKAELIFTFSDIKVNQPIAEDQFVYKPGSFEQKVDSFDFYGSAVVSVLEEDDEDVEPGSVEIEELTPERLSPLTKIVGQFSGHQAKTIDIDNDGVPELLLPEYQGGAQILDVNGEVIYRVRFKGTRGSSLMAIEVVQIDGRMHWFAAFTKHGGRAFRQKSYAALFDADGEELWRYEPEVAGKFSASLSIAAGDANGDGEAEFVIGVSTYRPVKMDTNSWMHNEMQAFVIVLDRAGQRLTVRKVGKTLQFLRVLEGLSSDEPATILILGDGQLKRFRLEEE